MIDEVSKQDIHFWLKNPITQYVLKRMQDSIKIIDSCLINATDIDDPMFHLKTKGRVSQKQVYQNYISLFNSLEEVEINEDQTSRPEADS